MARIGATFDGISREHIFQPDGTRRVTATYAIISVGWRTVTLRLHGRLR